jgi:hypothetical protein
MNHNNGIEELTRETRFLRIIARLAPDIPAQALRKNLALHVLVFRGRTREQLDQFAESGYFAAYTLKQKEAEAKFINNYQNRSPMSMHDQLSVDGREDCSLRIRAGARSLAELMRRKLEENVITFRVRFIGQPDLPERILKLYPPRRRFN